jgi:hypothetical protein
MKRVKSVIKRHGYSGGGAPEGKEGKGKAWSRKDPEGVINTLPAVEAIFIGEEKDWDPVLSASQTDIPEGKAHPAEARADCAQAAG